MWQQSGIADLLALTALSGVLLARSIWRRRQTAGANALFALVLAATLWAAASFVELSATRTSIKILAAKFEYVGVQNVPPLWVMFALSFAGRGHLVTLRRAIALWLVPAAVIALAVTNELHGTIWPAVQQVTTAAGTSLVFGHGPAVWVSVTYAYLLLLIGSVLVVATAVRSATVHRQRAVLLLTAVAVPWAANVVYFSGINPLPGIDLAPLALVVSGSLLSWSACRLQLVGAPVTHDALLMTLDDGVLVVDEDGQLVDINAAARKLLNAPDASAGRPAAEALRNWPGLAEHCFTKAAVQYEAILDSPEGTRLLDVRTSPLRRRRGRMIGRLIVLRDITEHEQTVAVLRQHDRLLETVSRAAELLLRTGEWQQSIPTILAQLGEAVRASRAYVCHTRLGSDGEYRAVRVHEWCAAGIRPQARDLELNDMSMRQLGLGRWVDLLSRNCQVDSLVNELPEAEQHVLSGHGIRSLIVLPIFVEGKWWGFLGFDDCARRRHWTGAETEALRLAASVIGGALQREHADQALAQGGAKLQRILESAVTAIGTLVETRDPYTAGHERRVALLAEAIAEELGLPQERRHILRIAALMHDVGKIGIPAELLTKPVALSDAEFQLMREHPEWGATVLASIDFEGPVAEIVRQHHERLDGSGYPHGLHEGEITLEARILAVADVAEAMASHRPYRPAHALEEVLGEINAGAGTRYDNDAASACARLLAEGRALLLWEGAAPLPDWQSAERR